MSTTSNAKMAGRMNPSIFTPVEREALEEVLAEDAKWFLSQVLEAPPDAARMAWHLSHCLAVQEWLRGEYGSELTAESHVWLIETLQRAYDDAEWYGEERAPILARALKSFTNLPVDSQRDSQKEEPSMTSKKNTKNSPVTLTLPEWQVQDPSESDELILTFQTAWAPPTEFFAALTAAYDVEVAGLWKDEMSEGLEGYGTWEKYLNVASIRQRLREHKSDYKPGVYLREDGSLLMVMDNCKLPLGWQAEVQRLLAEKGGYAA